MFVTCLGYVQVGASYDAQIKNLKKSNSQIMKQNRTNGAMHSYFLPYPAKIWHSYVQLFYRRVQLWY